MFISIKKKTALIDRAAAEAHVELFACMNPDALNLCIVIQSV
jgi:hypothetical protein